MGTIADLPVANRHKLTWSDVERMLAAGVIREDDRIEFIDGELIDMAPIGSSHASVVNQLVAQFSQQCGPDAIVSVQNPVALSDRSAPQPDVVLLRPRNDYYRSAHPGPNDVLLVIEVADTTLAYDRDIKIPLYARHGIREVWLVDLESRRVLIHREPRPDAGEYQRIEIRRDGVAAPAELPAASVDLSTLLA